MRKAVLFLLLIVLLTSCQKSYPEHLSAETLESLREQYPYDNGMDPLIFKRAPELASYVDIGSSYVVGTIVESGYVEFAKSWRYYPLKVQIQSVIYDEEFDIKEGDVITVRMPDYEFDYSYLEYPNDNTYVMQLWPSEDEVATSRFGWFYVTEDEYVLSVVSIGDPDTYSGWSLEEFSDTLKDMKG